ncbi:MAG: PLP-dependent aminotransferase family protein [Desulfurococcaceae archaeon]
MNRFDHLLSPTIKKIKASEIRELLKIIGRSKEIISFAGGIPDPKYFPKRELAEIAKEVIEDFGDRALQYSETMGVYECRRSIAEFMHRVKGVKADPDDVIITTGSQQAIDMIARAFLVPGDKVVTESPTYLASLGLFRAQGADVVGIKLDDHGMKTVALEEELKRLKSIDALPKFIYVIPTAQNPSGVTMSLERRKHLMELASKYDLIVVEDDPYSFFLFDYRAEATPLKYLDKEDRVIYISTASKILAPGIRIGWIMPPKELVRRLELLKQYMDLHSPTLNQYIFARALDKGVVDKHIEVVRKVYKEKRDHMIAALEEYFPNYIWFSRPIGGLFIFTYVFKEDFDAGALLEKAVNEYKVAYVPGRSFHPDGGGANSMRLNFSYPSISEIYEGVKRLAELVKNA